MKEYIGKAKGLVLYMSAELAGWKFGSLELAHSNTCRPLQTSRFLLQSACDKRDLDFDKVHAPGQMLVREITLSRQHASIHLSNGCIGFRYTCMCSLERRLDVFPYGHAWKFCYIIHCQKGMLSSCGRPSDPNPSFVNRSVQKNSALSVYRRYQEQSRGSGTLAIRCKRLGH